MEWSAREFDFGFPRAGKGRELGADVVEQLEDGGRDGVVVANPVDRDEAELAGGKPAERVGRGAEKTEDEVLGAVLGRCTHGRSGRARSPLQTDADALEVEVFALLERGQPDGGDATSEVSGAGPGRTEP